MNLALEGVSGTVYVEIEVNRQGRVADAAVRQVDLRKLADATQLARWRRDLERATLSAARKWTFNIPIMGVGAKRNQWFVTIPVNYTLSAHGRSLGPGYGQWDAYVPGPVQALPWTMQDAPRAAASGNTDAIPDTGEPFTENARFVLLTQLGDGGGWNQSAPEKD